MDFNDNPQNNKGRLTAFFMRQQEYRNRLPVLQQLAVLAAILFLIFSASVAPRVIALFDKTQVETPNQTKPQENAVAQAEDTVPVPFENMRITAKAAYVWDIQNQRALYKKEEGAQLPLASVTKLMTALVANEILSQSQQVEIGDLSIKQDGDSGLLEGEVFDRLTLSDLVLMSSSNDGAFALAAAAGSALSESNGAHAFVQAMNIRAEELGLSQTYYRNPTGLDISQTEAGAYGSARDVAVLMEHIVQHAPEILAFTRQEDARMYSKTGQYHEAENTNYYVEQIPGLIGSKTGYTDLAGGNLVVAFNVGLDRPIVAVVLGSTQQDRFSDIMTLVEETQQYVLQEANE